MGVRTRRTAGNDFLFYDPTTGTAETYRFAWINEEGRYKMARLRPHTGWRTTWTHIVPGQFGGDGQTDLLFYEASSGTGEFYTVAKNARLEPLRSHTGWRTSWSHIVPGYFGGRSGLLFYDADAGIGDFYAVSEGRLEQLSSHTDWRTSWNAIVPGDFAAHVEPAGLTHYASDDSCLLFYDAAAGTGEFYATDNGRMELLNAHTDWRTTWSSLARFDSEQYAVEL